MIFDVLRVDGMDAMCLPYADRRALLDALELEGPGGGRRRRLRTVRPYSRRLAGMDSRASSRKKRPEPDRPGERAWVKVKHRHYWRFGEERESAWLGRTADLALGQRTRFSAR
jgi:ATP-dependent DNA ligase